MTISRSGHKSGSLTGSGKYSDTKNNSISDNEKDWAKNGKRERMLSEKLLAEKLPHNYYPFSYCRDLIIKCEHIKILEEKIKELERELDKHTLT